MAGAKKDFSAKVRLTVDKTNRDDFNKEIQSMVDTIDIGKNLDLKDKTQIDKLAQQIQSELNGKKFNIKITKVDVNEAAKKAKAELQQIMSDISSDTTQSSTGSSSGSSKGKKKSALSAELKGEIKAAQTAINKAYSELGKLENPKLGIDLSVIQTESDECAKLTTELIKVKQGRNDDANAIRDQALARANAIHGMVEEATKNQKLTEAVEKNNAALERRRQLLLSSVNTVQSNNTRISGTSFQSELDQIRDVATNKESTEQDIEAARRKLSGLTQQIKEAGLAGHSLGETLGSAFSKITQYFSVYKIITTVISKLREAANASIELNESFTQLKIVTNATDSEMKKFADTTAEIAKNLGSNMTDIAASIETFSRLGYSLQDAAKLTESAGIMANTAAVSSSEATTGITSIIKGYGYSVDQAEHVADVLITVGQKYAVSAGEMMEAYQKAGAALNATNTSFEKSAGLIAAANASIQNASTVGTALKTVSARIRGSKTDLTDLGEGVEDLANGFSKYAKEIKSLTGFNIMVEGTKDQYKDIYEIFEGIAGVWDKLSDTSKSRVAEILGGTRQLQVISSIISNWSDAANAYDDAMNSVGASTKANDVYMQSTAAHVGQLKASFQDFSSNAFNTDAMNSGVDLLRRLIEVLNSLTERLDSYPLLDKILGADSSGLGSIQLVVSSLMGIHTFMNASQGDWMVLGKHVNQVTSQFKAAGEAGEKGIGRIKSALSTLRTALPDNIEAIFERFNDSSWVDQSGLSRVNSLIQEGIIKEEDVSVLTDWLSSLESGKGTLKDFKKYCKENNVAIEGMGVSAKAASIGVKILNTALNMIITMAIAHAISAIIQGFKQLAAGARDAAEAAGEGANELADQRAALDGYIDSFQEYRKVLDSGTSSKEDLLAATDNLNKVEKELIEQFGKEANGIDLVNGEIDTQIQKINALYDTSFEKWKAANSYGLTGRNGTLDSMNGLNGIEDAGAFNLHLAKDTNRMSIALREQYSAMMNNEYKEFVQSWAKDIQTVLPDSVSEVLGDSFDKTNDSITSIVSALFQANISTKELSSSLYALYDSLDEAGFEEFGSGYKDKMGVGLSYITNAIQYVDEKIKDNEETFNRYAEGVLSGDSYSEIYSKLQVAAKAYTDALKKGDYDAISNASDELKKIQGELDSLLNGIDGDKYEKEAAKIYINDYINSLFDIDSRTASEKATSAADETLKIIQEYKENVEKETEKVFSDANGGNIDLAQSVFGNIDLSNRKKIPLEDGTIATVLGRWGEFGENGEIKIAYTPIVNYDNEAEIKTEEQIEEYLNGVIEFAKEKVGKNKGKITLEEAIFEVDKANIGIIAAVGDSAPAVSVAMHAHEELSELANEQKVNIDMLLAATKDGADGFENYARSIISISSSIDSFQGALSSSGKALKQFEEDGVASADSVAELANAFSDVSGASSYIEDFANASSISEAKTALNGLANAYIESKGTLDQLSEADAKAVQKKLELIGVTNAEAVAQQAVANSYAKAIETEEQFKSAETKEIATQLVKVGAAKNEEEALKKILQAKIAASIPDFKDMTVEEIEQVEILCGWLGKQEELLAKTERLKTLRKQKDEWDAAGFKPTILESLNGFDAFTYDGLLEEISQLEKDIEDALKPKDAESIKADWNKIIKDLANGSKSLPEKYEERVKEIKHQLAMGKITEQEYYRALQQYMDQYLGEEELYVDERRSNLEAIHSYQEQALQDIYDTTKKMIEQRLNDQIDALEEEKDAIEDSVDAQKQALEDAADAYEDKIDKQIDAIEKKKTKIEEAAKAEKAAVEAEKKAMQQDVEAQIDAYESMKDAAEDAADAEKDAAEERYKAIEKEINKKLDLIEKERKAYQDLASAKKDALDDKADEEDYEYELSQKQSKLTSLLREQASLSNNDSASARKRRAELANEIAELQHDISTFVRDRSITLAKDEIDDDLDKKEAYLDAQKEQLNDELDSHKDAYDEEIKQIEAVRDAQIKSYEAQIASLNAYKEAQEAFYDQRISQIESGLEASKNALDKQKEQLEEQKEKFKSTIEAQKKALESKKDTQIKMLDAEIKAIKKNLNDQETLHKLTLEELQKDNADLYNDLIAYNLKYGSGIESDITNKWVAATEAAKSYSSAVQSILSVTAASINPNGSGDSNSAPKYASGTNRLPRSGIVETDEDGYEIKLNRKTGRHFEYMNAGSVILPNNATQKIMAFISNPSNYIRGVLGNNLAPQMQSAIAGDVSAVSTSISAPIEIVNTYNITGDNPQDIANEIKKTAQDCVDRAFDRLNSALRRNGMGRSVRQMS